MLRRKEGGTAPRGRAINRSPITLMDLSAGDIQREASFNNKPRVLRLLHILFAGIAYLPFRIKRLAQFSLANPLLTMFHIDKKLLTRPFPFWLYTRTTTLASKLVEPITALLVINSVSAIYSGLAQLAINTVFLLTDFITPAFLTALYVMSPSINLLNYGYQGLDFLYENSLGYLLNPILEPMAEFTIKNFLIISTVAISLLALQGKMKAKPAASEADNQSQAPGVATVYIASLVAAINSVLGWVKGSSNSYNRLPSDTDARDTSGDHPASATAGEDSFTPASSRAKTKYLDTNGTGDAGALTAPGDSITQSQVSGATI